MSPPAPFMCPAISRSVKAKVGGKKGFKVIWVVCLGVQCWSAETLPLLGCRRGSATRGERRFAAVAREASMPSAFQVPLLTLRLSARDCRDAACRWQLAQTIAKSWECGLGTGLQVRGAELLVGLDKSGSP